MLVKFLKRINPLKICIRRYSSVHGRDSFTVQSVQIPIPFVNGYISGKLWKTGNEENIEKYNPIICIPGWGDSVSAFEPIGNELFNQLENGHCLLAFDPAGHGFSYHSPGPYSDLHLEGILNILRIVKYYNWKNITIIGHSFGGLVGISFASIFPELIKCFVGLDIFYPLFINTDGHNQSHITRTCMEGLLDLENKILRSQEKPPPSYTREEMIKRMVEGRITQGGLTPEGCDMLLDRGSIKLDNGKYRFSHDPRNTQYFLLGRMSLATIPIVAQNIDCSVKLITCPTKNLSFKGVPIANDLFNILTKNGKNFEHVEIDGTHHVHMLEPHKVVPLIKKWIVWI